MSPLAERFAAFEEVPPPDLFGDPIWRLPAYRIALFLSDLLPGDTSMLWRTRCPPYIVDQLPKAVDSIRANISEGYSKFSGRERARYYETALCSAREARDWYRRAIPWLGKAEAYERGALVTRVIKILLVAVPQERSGANEYRIRRKFRDGKKEDGRSDSDPDAKP
jgi:four helix bundle protein